MGSVLVPLGFGAAASAATLVGGWVALRFQRRMTLIVGLAAGIVLGVALFDLIPEALSLARDVYTPTTVLICVAFGFAAYLAVSRALGGADKRAAGWRSHLGAASLTLHSFLDGMGIGLASQISPAVGWAVALAVLTHDVADGINTVSLSLLGSEDRITRRWLYANGAAPLLGVMVGLCVRMPNQALVPLLGIFGGAFLYIGTCELIPRSHALDPRLRVTAASLGGILVMMVVTAWAK